MTQHRLHERLGGVNAIAVVVDHFSDEIVKNQKVSVNPALKPGNAMGQLPGLQFMRALWRCETAGRPFEYAGTKPGDAHQNLYISADVDEVGAEIASALDHFRVPGRESGKSCPPSPRRTPT
jgi:hemoglobin